MHIFDRGQTADLIHTSMDASVIPGSWVLAGTYALLAFAHHFMLPEAAATTMTSVAAMTSGVFLVVALRWRYLSNRFDARPLISLLSVLIGLNTSLHLWLVPSPDNTVNFIIWALGNSFMILSQPWFAALTSLNVASWTSIVMLRQITPLDNWGWYFGLAIVISVLIHLQRQYSMLAFATRTNRRNEILQGIISAPEMTKEDTTDLFQRVCEAACRELNVNRFGVWLTNQDRSILNRVILWESGKAHLDPIAVKGQDIPDLFDRIFRSPTVPLEAVVREPGLAPVLRNIGIEIDQQGLLISTVKVGDHVMGVTTAVANSHRTWTVEDRAFSASLANVVAMSLQHSQTLQLEKRALQSDRLESLGILAGGVAHDFNNLLAVIMGHAELLQLKPGQSEESVAGLEAISTASLRAKDLTQKMLAYAGRARFDKHSTDLVSFTRELTDTVVREQFSDVVLSFSTPPPIPLTVDIDTSQMHRVLLDLVANAKNAGATHVEIRLGSELLKESPPNSVLALDLLPHRFHWLEVEDNGTGIEEHLIGKIFEPFFSTRISNTGLGLAAIQGILRAHRGTITVHSTLNKGTRIRAYFPQSTTVVGDDSSLRELPANYPVNRRILLVEDQPLVRRMTKTLLEQGDNQVFAFDGLRTTIEFLDQATSPHFDLAILDLTLREESGMTVLSQIRQRQPDLPAVIMSGYDAMDVLKDYPHEKTVAFLQKPYSHQELWDAIRTATALMTNATNISQIEQLGT